MQKTRLGIPVGLLGATIFFVCFFGGYTSSIILVGYVLLFEENAWLKRSAIRGAALLLGFSVLSALIGLIPNAITLINSVFNVFGGNFYISFVTNVINVINNFLNVAERILFILLGIKALNQGTVKIPVIDSLVSRYMD
jgi:uncharacterized membrane protein